MEVGDVLQNSYLVRITDVIFLKIVFSALVDLYLALYPAFILFHLQMSLRKKIALSAALGLGSVYVLCDF